METKIINLDDLKFNLSIWLNELKFYKSELALFEKKLGEISVRKYGLDAMIPLEGFQNRIMKERDALNKLKHRLKFKINNLEQLSVYDDLDEEYQQKQLLLSDHIITFTKLHSALKNEIMNYLLSWA